MNTNNEISEVGPNTGKHLLYIKRVAMYLILRHATPSSGAMLSSYTYSKFKSRPLLLQSIALLGSVAAVVSSWTYGRKIAKTFASLSGLKIVLIITTIASSLWSLLSISFIHIFREQEGGTIPKGILFVVLYAAFQLSEGFLGELSFLPSVILASTSTAFEETSTDNDYDDSENCAMDDQVIESENIQQFCDDVEIEVSDEKTGLRLDDGLQYGLLIACIDFGDQLSDFVSMPIIEMLEIRRDNDWKNLEYYVVVCSLLSIGSLLFLKFLKP